MVVGLGGQGWAVGRPSLLGPEQKLGAKAASSEALSLVAFDPGLGRAFLLALR